MSSGSVGRENAKTEIGIFSKLIVALCYGALGVGATRPSDLSRDSKLTVLSDPTIRIILGMVY